MDVNWNDEDGTLTVDSHEYQSEDDRSPIEVRVSDLRRLDGDQLPEGVKVKAVRKVIGSSNDLYGDPDTPSSTDRLSQALLSSMMSLLLILKMYLMPRSGELLFTGE